MRLKSTSREKQQDFLEHLKSLFQDPSALVPECIDGGLLCPFRSYEKKLSSARDPQDFSKYSRSADQILAGLSETFRVLESGSAGVMGVLKTQFGSVEYSKRGGATDDTVLAGIQHYDDPLWRMLAYSSLVRTRNVRVYSSSNFFLGSCKNSSPGVEFFKDVLNDENAQFTSNGQEISIGNTGHSLTISHLRATKIIVYENSTLNTINLLLKHILTPDISADFTFSCDFLSKTVDVIPQNSLALYMQGKINDRTFIRDTVDFRTKEAVRLGHFIIGDEAFTTAAQLVEKFPFKYVPDDVIINALSSFGKGFYIDAFSERKILEILWPSHGKQILQQVFPEATQDQLSQLKGSPLDQIDYLQSTIKGKNLRESVEVSGWSQDSKFLVDLLMDYFANGQDRAIRNAERNLGNSNVRKALYFAFLDCLGEGGNRSWQFTDTEKDLAWKIRDHVCAMVKNGPGSMQQELENVKIFIK